MDTLISSKAAKQYLRDAAAYFMNRPTEGEDSKFWANVQNAENCRRIARLIESLEPIPEEMTEEELLRGLEHIIPKSALNSKSTD